MTVKLTDGTAFNVEDASELVTLLEFGVVNENEIVSFEEMNDALQGIKPLEDGPNFSVRMSNGGDSPPMRLAELQKLSESELALFEDSILSEALTGRPFVASSIDGVYCVHKSYFEELPRDHGLGFCWPGFFFPQVWGLKISTGWFLAILCPPVAGLYLGIHGWRDLWRTRTYPNVEEMVRANRGWLWAGIASYIIPIAGWILLSIALSGSTE